ncbi:hypothetical protein FZEAL_6900 [Fusarium zealandicum]|uniref:Uncharacterized protein n=1 Tax=Fusarium zealandicum TaxID=1053134 RepID=A0A8H4UHF1_9HYPO|nr:hypothetical protein FZEAL_6900 [Fusarium zealandicum]
MFSDIPDTYPVFKHTIPKDCVNDMRWFLIALTGIYENDYKLEQQGTDYVVATHIDTPANLKEKLQAEKVLLDDDAVELLRRPKSV